VIDQRLLEILPSPSRLKLQRIDEDRRAATVAAFDAGEEFRRIVPEYVAFETSTLARLSGYGDASKEFGPSRQSMMLDWAAYERALRADATAWNSPHFEWRRAKLPQVVRAQEAAARREEELQNFGFLGAVESWLKRVGYLGDTLKPAKPVAVPEGVGIDVIAACRRKLLELDAAWAAAEGAPLPIADMKANLASALDQIADRGEPVLDPRRRETDPFGLGALFQQLTFRNPTGGIISAGGSGDAFLLWIFRSEVEERLLSMIPKNDAPGALNDVQREARFAEIASARLEAERIEEAVICRAAADGFSVPRRRDADPRAVLEVVA